MGLGLSVPSPPFPATVSENRGLVVGALVSRLLLTIGAYLGQDFKFAVLSDERAASTNESPVPCAQYVYAGSTWLSE